MNAPANFADRVALLSAASVRIDPGMAGVVALLSQVADTATAALRAGFDAQLQMMRDCERLGEMQLALYRRAVDDALRQSRELADTSRRLFSPLPYAEQMLAAAREGFRR